MADVTNKSFRIQEPGLKALDGLKDYFSDANRSDICAAALKLYAEKGGDADCNGNEAELPFDFCEPPVSDVLNCAYKIGRTDVPVRIIVGKSQIEIAKKTPVKCSGLSGVTFEISSKTGVTIDLASSYKAELYENGTDTILKLMLSEE